MTDHSVSSFKIHRARSDSAVVFRQTQATISWKNICYTVDDGNRIILDGVSGMAKPGQLMAIIGSTGSGKSTLLDILAGRAKSGIVTGDIRINGENPKRIFKRLGAYVTQDELLMGTLTVEETFQFYARLKLNISNADQDSKVEDIIDKFGLSGVSSSRIGTPVQRGLSGGEKRRVAIGCEFITDPSLILLDEPTSGLDSVNAYSIMEELQKLAHNEHRTVITTVHQPSGKMFRLFDQLMIMSLGRIVYFGSAMGAIDYFRDKLGKSCGQFENPADFFLEAIEELAKEVPLIDYNSNSEQQDEDEEDDSTLRRPTTIHKKRTNMLVQFLQLLWRNSTNMMRDPRTSYAQLGQSIFLALLVGSIYFGLKLDQKSIQNRMGAIFFIITNQAFGGFPMLSLFLEERELFKRERASGLYGVFPYFIAKFLTEIPILIFYPIVFSSIAYWMIGFQGNVDHFLLFCATIIAEVTCTSSLFVAVGAIAPNQAIAQILAPISLVLFMLFGGFFVNTDDIPVYYIWLKYMSFFKYAYEILIYNEMHGLVFECPAQGEGCIRTGDIQLQILGMSKVEIWQNIVILFGMALLYRVIAFLIIFFFHKEKK